MFVRIQLTLTIFISRLYHCCPEVVFERRYTQCVGKDGGNADVPIRQARVVICANASLVGGELIWDVIECYIGTCIFNLLLIHL